MEESRTEKSARPASSGARLLGLLLAIGLSIPSLWAQAEDEAEQAKTAFRKQAALFHKKCAKCHTVGRGDRVGPDLKGVYKHREKEWILSFIQNPDQYLDTDPYAQELLKKFNGVRMTNLHLSRAQAEDLLAYIKTASEGPALAEAVVPLEKETLSSRVQYPREPAGFSPAGMVVFFLMLIGSGILWRFAGRDVAAIPAVLTAACAYWAFGGLNSHRLLADNQGYSPVQPIAYSHKVHAGDLEIACLYCHHGAAKGPVAGVPSVNVCMNCHRIVKETSKGPSAEIKKLLDVWDARNGEMQATIEWVRVHRLPDHVSFSHQVHVQNNIQCQECHGPIETMDQVHQASHLTMGWCLNCHRKKGSEAPSHWKRSNATQDCSSCHQ